MIEQAKYYLKNKLSVIPVGKDKRPLVEWKKYQKQLATEKELEEWFRLYPEMQIGIVTGKISKITVVDIDDPAMDLNWLPETAVVKTGSGGFHYYYQYAPMPNKARIRDKVDIRGDGGYVIAPPSSNLKGEYKWLKKVQPTSFPVSLFGQKRAKKVNSLPTEYVGKAEGGRNDEMTRWVGHLLAKIHPSEWETIGWKMTVEANEKNQPPLEEQELRIIFESIKGKEQNNTTPRWYEENPECNIKVKQSNARYTWGTNGLDKSLAIIKRGNFIIVGAKRSSGKTTFTFDMACKNALLGHKVLYISLEMDEQKIKEDFARKYAGITIEEEYYYLIPERKQLAFEKKIKELESIDTLYFRGMRRGSGTSWADVIKTIGEFEELDLIVIDNLDLIEGEKGENNNDRQIRITKKIMNFTEEKQVPLVLIHHHRKSSAYGKDSGADELSGSGKIGDNADIILKINRNQDPEALPPFNCESMIYQQKGRGYPNAMRKVYFIKGSFEDEPFENI